METEPGNFDLRLNPKHELGVAAGILGIALQHKGQVNDAVRYYEKALSYDPGLADINDRLANIYGSQGKVTSAISCYRNSLDVDPDRVETRLDLAMNLSMAKRFDEAIEHCA